jgi:hypothetical protein
MDGGKVNSEKRFRFTQTSLARHAFVTVLGESSGRRKDDMNRETTGVSQN